MECMEFRAMLDNYASLTDEEKLRLEEHSEKCPECKAELEFLLSVIGTVNTLPKIEPPADFLEKLNSRIDKEEKNKQGIWVSFKKHSFAYSGLAACLLLAAVIGVNGKLLGDKMMYNDDGAMVSYTITSEDDTQPEISAAPLVSVEPMQSESPSVSGPRATSEPKTGFYGTQSSSGSKAGAGTAKSSGNAGQSSGSGFNMNRNTTAIQPSQTTPSTSGTVSGTASSWQTQVQPGSAGMFMDSTTMPPASGNTSGQIWPSFTIRDDDPTPVPKKTPKPATQQTGSANTDENIANVETAGVTGGSDATAQDSEKVHSTSKSSSSGSGGSSSGGSWGSGSGGAMNTPKPATTSKPTTAPKPTNAPKPTTAPKPTNTPKPATPAPTKEPVDSGPPTDSDSTDSVGTPQPGPPQPGPPTPQETDPPQATEPPEEEPDEDDKDIGSAVIRIAYDNDAGAVSTARNILSQYALYMDNPYTYVLDFGDIDAVMAELNDAGIICSLDIEKKGSKMKVRVLADSSD